MARMVDTAWAMRLVSGATLHAMLDDLAQRGRPGIRVMRQVLADRGLDYVPPASSLESRVAQILRDAALPVFQRQVNLGDAHGWIGRVDFRAVDRPVVLEVQSERFHASLIDHQLDAERLSRLRAAGFAVVEITETEVWHRPERLVRKVREACRLIELSA
jgi:very-short-patch-repair endonuclease